MPHVKYRNMFAQVGLMIVTLGFYQFYWFYQTAFELKILANDDSARPGLWTILIFVPFGCFYSWYKYAELFEKVGAESINKWILFLFWVLFAPAVWFIVQLDLNRKATGESS